jgi:hypothetical protein
MAAQQFATRLPIYLFKLAAAISASCSGEKTNPRSQIPASSY